MNGRVVDHRRLDYRSPAWAVSSLAYSRAVTAVAASWLAVWREAHGDTTHTPRAQGGAARAGHGRRPHDRPMTRRALLSVSRKEGIVELARGLVERGFEVLSTGGTASELEKAGVTVTGGLEGHGLPRDPRRAREDAAPEDPRRHPRAPRPARAPAGAREARHPADRRRGREPLPLRGQGREGRELRRGDREHRHRRPHDGARGGQELRVGRGGGRPRRLPAAARAARPRGRDRPRRRGSTSRRRRSATPAATRPRSPPTSRRSSSATGASCRPRPTRRSRTA